MIKTLTFSALASLAVLQAQAFELGRVISTTPVIQQVAVPQQVCHNTEAVVSRSTGTGAAIGAIAGGALGASARGSARLPATVIGAWGGAVIGDRLEGNRTQIVQSCVTQNVYENRAVAYNVVYEYAGRQYNATLREDPGTTMPVEVSPAGGIQMPPQAVIQAPAPLAAAPVTYTVYSTPYPPPPVVVNPPVVVYQRPYIDPIYPALAVGVGLAAWGGYRYGHHHRHHSHFGGRRLH
jgi:uncharacterized protein YcfJ